MCLTGAVVAGCTFPYAELSWKCRAASSASEACVWARAYFPMSRWIEPLVITPIVLVVALILFAVADRTR